MPSLPSKHKLRVYPFWRAQQRLFPALKPAPGTGDILISIGISLEEEFFPKGKDARSEGLEVLLACPAFPGEHNILEEREASKPRECWQQPSKVLLPTRSVLTSTKPEANWFCTDQGDIPAEEVKMGLGSQDISLQTEE